MNVIDGDTIERFRHGDRAAFEVIFRRYASLVYTVARPRSVMWQRPRT